MENSFAPSHCCQSVLFSMCIQSLIKQTCIHSHHGHWRAGRIIIKTMRSKILRISIRINKGEKLLRYSCLEKKVIWRKIILSRFTLHRRKVYRGHCFVLCSRCGAGVGGGGVRRPGLCISRVNCGHHHAGSPCLSHVRGAGSRVKLGSVIRPVLVMFLLFDITVWILKISFTSQCNYETEYMLIKFLL